MVSPSVRRILHCDMDSFYAAVHMRDDPSLQGLPVVIGGSPKERGVVAAASYEARRFGIRSAMPAARAVRLCPRVVFLRPDFSRYRKESQAIFEIFRRFTPVVQPVSIDEAYLDVSEHLEPLGNATAVATAIKHTSLEELEPELDRLSERVAQGLARRGLSACTFTVKIRYGDFTTVTRARTINGPTCDPEAIKVYSRSLLRRSEAGERPVRYCQLEPIAGRLGR